MKRFILAFLLAAGPAFAADLIARNGNNELRLSDKPCTNEQVLALIPPQYREQFASATAFIEGQVHEGCWTDFGGRAWILYSDGDRGSLPLSAFKPAMSI